MGIKKKSREMETGPMKEEPFREKQPSTSGVTGATKFIDISQRGNDSDAANIPVIYTKVEVPETD